MEHCKNVSLEGLLEGMTLSCCDGFAVYLDRGVAKARVEILPTECDPIQHSASVAPIIVGAIGILVLLSLVVGIIYKCRKHFKASDKEGGQNA